MKWSRLFLSLLLVLVVSAVAFSLVAHADDQPDTVTATETEEAEDGQSIGQDEQSEPEEPEAEPTLEDTQEEPDVTEDESTGDRQVSRETVQLEYITSNDYEYETLATLKSIEYQLKIISGGVIITALCFFCWLTIYLPIKKFMYV